MSDPTVFYMTAPVDDDHRHRPAPSYWQMTHSHHTIRVSASLVAGCLSVRLLCLSGDPSTMSALVDAVKESICVLSAGTDSGLMGSIHVAEIDARWTDDYGRAKQ